MVLEALNAPYRKALAIKAFPHFREIVLLASAYFIYVYTRAIFFSDVRTVALENAQRVVDFEKKIGFFWEPTWQNWTDAHVWGPELVPRKQAGNSFVCVRLQRRAAPSRFGR